MAVYAELHDGRRLEFPDGTDPAVMQATVKKVLGAPPQEPSSGGVLGYLKDSAMHLPGDVADLVAGGVKGASQIGATLVAPYDMAKDALAGKGLSLESNRQRRADVTGALSSLGADTNSPIFKAGDIGAQVLGTLGVGPALGTGAAALGAAPRVVQALTSGGFSTGGPLTSSLGSKAADMALRVGAGAAGGGAAAGLVNPQDFLTGAGIGGALPPATKLAGASAEIVANAWRSATTPREVKLAQQLAQQLGVSADDLKAAMTGPQMIPGYQRTVPQILQTPLASQLQRSLKTAGGDALGEAERLQQSQFREALGRIGPTDVTVQDAANRAGGAIQDYALPAEAAARKRVGALFDAVPSNEAVMQLPISQMDAARAKYLGPGTFGKGGAPVDQAIEEAMAIGARPAPRPVFDYSSSDLSRKAAGGHGHGLPVGPVEPQPVPFDQLQKLRSSIGEAITQADKNGQNQAKAALTTMKNAIDNKVADVAAGNALPGEVFTPEAIDAWGQALNAHSAKKLQFNTGPQASMFRQGGDGQAAIQGAEIPGQFFNSRRSQVEDMQAFKRLIGSRDDLAQEMKRFAIADAMNTTPASGDLGAKFRAWLKMRSGTTGELFTPQEMATVNEVGKAVERSMKAENLGRVNNSDTAQKLMGLQSNGLLDSKLADVLAHKIPLVGSFTGPMLDSLRRSATQTKQGVMAGLLANPADMESALRSGMGKGLLNMEPEALGLLSQSALRAVPLLGVRQ